MRGSFDIVDGPLFKRDPRIVRAARFPLGPQGALHRRVQRLRAGQNGLTAVRRGCQGRARHTETAWMRRAVKGALWGPVRPPLAADSVGLGPGRGSRSPSGGQIARYWPPPGYLIGVSCVARHPVSVRAESVRKVTGWRALAWILLPGRVGEGGGGGGGGGEGGGGAREAGWNPRQPEGMRANSGTPVDIRSRRRPLGEGIRSVVSRTLILTTSRSVPQQHHTRFVVRAVFQIIANSQTIPSMIIWDLTVITGKANYFYLAILIWT